MAGDLVLGSVVFRGFEVPERIQFGGRQQLAVHDLPGGGRVVDVMGDRPKPVTWSGVFSGPNAAARVRVLERLRRRGEALPLSWQGWRYMVVVASFEVRLEKATWIPYRIEACVLASGDTALPTLDGFVFSVAEAAAFGVGLGAGPGLDGAIDAAGLALGSDDPSSAIAAAGELARLVTARAILEAAA